MDFCKFYSVEVSQLFCCVAGVMDSQSKGLGLNSHSISWVGLSVGNFSYGKNICYRYKDVYLEHCKDEFSL